MALDKNILGQALYDELDDFNNKNPTDFGNMEAQRLAFCKKLAEVVIDHIKTNGVVEVNTTGSSSAQHGYGTIS